MITLNDDDIKSCSYDCFNCVYSDCVSDNPPDVDLDEYMQFGIDVNRKLISALDEATVTPTVEEEGLNELISADLAAFCIEKGIKPRTASDVAILRRCMEEGYKGKKLEKAIYKVRHRDELRLQKKRQYIRKKYGM